MPIAAHEERARDVDRKVERRADGEVLQVDVAAIRAGRDRALPAQGARRPRRHDAEEGRERHLDAGRETRHLPLEVEGDDKAAVQGELVGKPAFPHAHRIDAVGRPRRYLEDMDGERVAGLGAGDMDGARDDVRAEAAMLHLGIERNGVGERLHLVAGEEDGGIPLIGEEALMRDGVDRHRIAGPHEGDGIGGAPEIAPMHGLGAAADAQPPVLAGRDQPPPPRPCAPRLR